MPAIYISEYKKHIFEVSLCCLGFMIFSLFIHSGFPLVLLSFAGLAMSCYIISCSISTYREFLHSFGLVYPKRIGLTILIGLLLGLIYSTLYRIYSGMDILPKSLHYFALVAALIGTVEELTFRGYIQELAGKINTSFGVVFATFSHTAYKCCLFILPFHNSEVTILYLFLLTFGAGLFLGLLKEFSKSVIPAIIAHAFFDILVYGECIQSPWWVW